MFIVSILLFASCADKYDERGLTNKLISCEETLEIITQKKPSYKIIDIRKSEQYNEGHIPGSINTWRPEYEDYDNEIKGMMAGQSQMESLLQSWGLSYSDTLILYDGRGNSNACRLWWILRQYGFERVKILDGSYIRWQQLQYPVDTVSHKAQMSTITLGKLDHKFYASLSDVQHHLKGEGILLDSRTKEEYDGELKKGNVKRGGHIPTAIRFDWSEMVELDEIGNGRFKELEIIRERLEKEGINQEDDIIVYCQSGVRSACVTFVLTEMLGFENVRNYDGSWLEWGNTDLEIE